MVQGLRVVPFSKEAQQTLARELVAGTSRLLAAADWRRDPAGRSRVLRGRYHTARGFLVSLATGAVGTAPVGGRRQADVSRLYERRWGGAPEPQSRFVEFGGAVLTTDEDQPVNGFYIMALAHLIRLTRPARVLEVGSGKGFNLNHLAPLFPECQFVGLELTSAGVREAKQRRDDPAIMRRAHEKFSATFPVGTRADSGPMFCRGSAARLPFPDGSFDLVVSVLALEQMNPIRSAVLAEMARVTRAMVAQVEPFAEFNRNVFARMHLRNKDYFRTPVAALTEFGLQPVFTWGGFPQKLHFGAGLVVSQKQSAP